MNKKWLIAVDLDGTLLEGANGGDEWTNFDIPQENIEVLQHLSKKGHKVMIITGRPWRDTKEVYDKLGIPSLVANYNGAYIHNPHDEKFMTAESSMNRILIEEMMETTSLKNCYSNFIIEYKEFTHVLKMDEEIMKQIHLPLDSHVTVFKQGDRISEDPFSIIFKIKPANEDVYDLLSELKRKYGDTFLFRFWDDKAKENFILEVNQKAVTKETAMKYTARYYNIDPSRTIAFGDGMNDTDMLVAANMGVAMKNAKGVVKSYAKDVTDFDNTKAGVGKYLKLFFKDEFK